MGTALPARLISRVTRESRQGAMWPKGAPSGTHRHRAEVPCATFGIDDSWIPDRCHECGAAYDGSELSRFGRAKWVYGTVSGEPEPGDLYWVDESSFSERGDYCSGGWTNCDGQHLHGVLPNGQHWDIDGRASNCGLPKDTVHRCWVRHGVPPFVTVDKAGVTCPAGAGSIAIGDWHGFLRQGKFVT